MCKDCPPIMIKRITAVEVGLVKHAESIDKTFNALEKSSKERFDLRKEYTDNMTMVIMGSIKDLEKKLKEQNIKELDERYPTRRELKVFTVTAGVFSGCLGFIVGTYLRYFR